MSELYEHQKINSMSNGWYVVLEDGSVYTEQDSIPWKKILNKSSKIKKKSTSQGVLLVGLKNRNKRVEIRGKQNYLPPGTRQLKEMTVGGNVLTTRSEIVGRFIGYYGTQGKVVTYVDRKTGQFRTEIMPY